MRECGGSTDVASVVPCWSWAVQAIIMVQYSVVWGCLVVSNSVVQRGSVESYI